MTYPHVFHESTLTLYRRPCGLTSRCYVPRGTHGGHGPRDRRPGGSRPAGQRLEEVDRLPRGFSTGKVVGIYTMRITGIDNFATYLDIYIYMYLSLSLYIYMYLYIYIYIHLDIHIDPNS